MRVYCKSCICGNLTSATARLWGKKRINVNSTSYGESKYFFGGVQMYAVIKTGGKQYKVAKGDSVFVEKLEVKPGDEVTFDEVILVNSHTKYGHRQPYTKVTIESIEA